jgi:alpha-tubulin suppressor-like RCC1 family protein
MGFLAPAGVLLTLMACSSDSDVARSPDENGDGGDGSTTSDGAIPSEPAEDAGGDASDAGEIEPPPPYDFAVKCSSQPCIKGLAARGGAHACAVLQDGSARCWGANASGQLGAGRDDAGAIADYEATPRPVPGLSSAMGVAATGQGMSGTTCVVSGAGDVACFGSNAWGQLGRADAGSTGPFPDPGSASGVQAKSVTLTNTFALAIGTDDRLWSWGTNDARQLARATSGPDAGSASAAALADSVSSTARACAGTSKTGFVVSEDGDLLSWGGGSSEQLGRFTSLARDPIPAAIAISDVSAVATGVAHACALHRGRVHCWGENEDGQLGTGRKLDELAPAPVRLPPDVYAVAVAAGGNDTCVIAADGAIYCWGAARSGQIGAPSPFGQPNPVKIEGLGEQAVAVAIMDESICALLRGGSVACWGDNLVGQLGRGSADLELHTEPGPVVFE